MGGCMGGSLFNAHNRLDFNQLHPLKNGRLYGRLIFLQILKIEALISSNRTSISTQ